MSKFDCKRHIMSRFVACISVHNALISCALLFLTYCLGYVFALRMNPSLELYIRCVVADLLDYILRYVLVVNLCRKSLFLR